MLSGYPKEHLKGFRKEFTKDRRLHVDVLNGLTEEIGKRCYGDRRFYLRALGYSFLTPSPGVASLDLHLPNGS